MSQDVSNVVLRCVQQAATDGVTYPDGSALDVKTLMDPWLNQMGYPLLTVSRHSNGTATVSAVRYLNPPGQIVTVSSPYKYVPYVLRRV